ncbi:hypothetical protein BYT27DRAFT_7136160 [Phlegmacium glaucopus]|nr:hypothetical protein BYT27DRAFT_7136160 [Phlegmacium glaucopus]
MATPTITDAQPPFHSSAKSDVILRSSDNVDFYVLKLLLSLSSSFFESMFSLPQPINSASQKTNQLPIIELTEDSETLQAFLPFFYPGIAPRVGNLDDIINVIVAGQKYDVDSAVKQMSQELLDLPLMTEDPLRIFALAFHHGWEAIGRAAAKNTLGVSVSELKFSSELAYISGKEVFQLSQYRLQCVSAIRNISHDGRFFTGFYKPDTKLPRRGSQYISTNSCDHRLAQKSGSLSEGCIFTPWPEDVNGLGLPASPPTLLNWDDPLAPTPPRLKWWVFYIRELFKEVEARPQGRTVTEDRLSNIAIQRAMVCSLCSQHVHRDIAKFKDSFASKIEEEISKVLLDVDFSGYKSRK